MLEFIGPLQYETILYQTYDRIWIFPISQLVCMFNGADDYLFCYAYVWDGAVVFLLFPNFFFVDVQHWF